MVGRCLERLLIGFWFFLGAGCHQPVTQTRPESQGIVKNSKNSRGASHHATHKSRTDKKTPSPLINDEVHKVVMMTACEEGTLSDMEMVAKELSEQLAKHGIHLEVLAPPQTESCGYVFYRGEKKKRIKGLLTDADLWEKCVQFFFDGKDPT